MLASEAEICHFLVRYRKPPQDILCSPLTPPSSFVWFSISFLRAIIVIFRWGVGEVSAFFLQGILGDTYLFAFSHLAAVKTSWSLICSTASPYCRPGGFRTESWTRSFSSDMQRRNPVV